MTRGESRGRPSWTALAWAAGLLVVAGIGVLTHVETFTQLSHIDEYQHVDYLDRTMHLEHVNGGETVGELAMREQACRGIDLEGVVLPPCDSPDLQPEQFPGAGYDHTYFDPPTYYAITGPLANLAQKVTGVDSLVTAARGVGVLWLGAGLVVTFLLARRLGANDVAAAGATILLGGLPIVLQASATVTTDAPQLLLGGALTLLALAVVEHRASIWWLLPAGAAVMAFKSTSLAVVGVVGLFLLVTAVQSMRHREGTEKGGWFAALLPAGLLLAGGLATSVTWTAIRKATALSTVDDVLANKPFEVESIGWPELANSVLAHLSPVADTNTPAFTQTASLLLLAALLNLLLVAAAAGLWWFGARGEHASRMAGCVLVGMLLGGPAFTALFFLGEGLYIFIPGRYGLSLLPIAVACLAVAASHRRYGGPALMLSAALGFAAFVSAAL